MAIAFLIVIVLFGSLFFIAPHFIGKRASRSIQKHNEGT